ncbi:YMC2 (YBR104W) and YMC1 (YPR058W) [Zygosaccharomyces parabailii]|nr:YMC2 (YBR104W) and YMC1 (YPR058W) [Zygosaccharomyces parabailii]CDH08601.1 probable Carrier protein YMC1, mitochondrial [Zygosaccharomyces bailii ISA1307]
MSEEFPAPQLIDDLEGSSKQNKTRVAKDLLAGTAGGIAQVLVGQPFDTTKVRLQTSSAPTTAKEVISNLLRKEGPLAFYKGTLTPLIGVGACVSLQFGVNEAMKRYFHSKNTGKPDTLTLTQYYTCGVAGGLSNSLLAAPIEHVRIRLQTQTGSGADAAYKGPLDCIKQLRSQGKLMRGLGPTALREAHGIGIYFLTYEAMVADQVRNGVPRVDIPAWKLCFFGALSGTALWLMVFPVDVVKSVMQTDDLFHPKYGKSSFSVAGEMWRRHGLSSFFKGFGPTMLRAAPANAATFATFELIMRLLG